MTRRAFVVVLLLHSFSASAQSEHPITGRHIAPVMGAAGADWLDRSDRVREEQPEKALDLIGIHPGMNVADLGAGTGYMTLRMARRVGPHGRVWAVDIQPAMLERLTENARKADLSNIETVLGTEADPKLPPASMDLVIMVDVYHELSRPQEMLQSIRACLKPDGRLVLVEYKKEDPAIPIRPDHKMTLADIKAEVEAEGYKLDKAIDALPRQHVVIFKKLTM